MNTLAFCGEQARSSEAQKLRTGVPPDGTVDAFPLLLARRGCVPKFREFDEHSCGGFWRTGETYEEPSCVLPSRTSNVRHVTVLGNEEFLTWVLQTVSVGVLSHVPGTFQPTIFLSHGNVDHKPFRNGYKLKLGFFGGKMTKYQASSRYSMSTSRAGSVLGTPSVVEDE